MNAEAALKTGLKLLAACFAVGLVLAFLDIDPRRLIADIPGTIREIADTAIGIFAWAWPYIALGAVIVLPVWGVLMLLRLLRRR